MNNIAPNTDRILSSLASRPDESSVNSFTLPKGIIHGLESTSMGMAFGAATGVMLASLSVPALVVTAGAFATGVAANMVAEVLDIKASQALSEKHESLTAHQEAETLYESDGVTMG